MRRIGVLSGLALEDPESKARIAAFLDELRRSGWSEGRNIRLDVRSGEANAAERRKNAAETAEALGLEVPATLLARADEVIE